MHTFMVLVAWNQDVDLLGSKKESCCWCVFTSVLNVRYQMLRVLFPEAQIHVFQFLCLFMINIQMKMMSLFTRPHVVPILKKFISSVKHSIFQVFWSHSRAF